MKRRGLIDVYHRLMLSLAKGLSKNLKDEEFDNLMERVRREHNSELKVKLYAHLKGIVSR